VSAAPSVHFVVTPFLPEHQPAIGVSLLSGVLRQRGIESEISYLNLEYKRRIGAYMYAFLSRVVPSEMLLAEMVFARALWGERADWDAYERQFRISFVDFARQVPHGDDEDTAIATQAMTWSEVADRVRVLFEEAPAVVAAWADRLLAGGPRVLGFTSTFQQNVASLALAQELRRRAGEGVKLIFGGANCEDEMGRAMADNFTFVDYVVSGEAERVIERVVRDCADPAAPRGFVAGERVTEMDALPVPSFDAYFSALEPAELEKATLVAESSRGCWWGQRSHCKFCGLNGTSMQYRSKSPDRFAAEVAELFRRYGRERFYITDNILDLGYVSSFFPEMAARGTKVRLFYETKSNLRKEQLELMAAGGVDMIQPGIESLSTDVLRLMAKGTTRLQNVQLLKFSEEFRVSVKWNLLYGFPGEPAAEYEAMRELMPALYHLPPPSGYAKIRLDRFGPYWMAPEQNGMTNVHPFWTYDFVYPGLSERERSRIAYFFEYDYADGRVPYAYAKECIDSANAWILARRRGATLELRGSNGRWYVADSRTSENERTTAISDKHRAVLRLLDHARLPDDALKEIMRDRFEGALDPTEFRALTDEMLERRWIIEDSGKLLSLVLNRSEFERVVDRRVAIQMDDLGLTLMPA